MATKNVVGKLLNKKSIGVMGGISLAANAYSTVSDYKQSRLEGHGKVGSAVTAVGNAVMFEAMGFWPMMALTAAKELPNMVVNGALKANAAARTMDKSARNVAFNNATFADSKQAFTMRQAGMQMAQASKYNLQQTLMGNEASVMHRL